MANGKIAVRIGSHAEKEYFLKLSPYFDGLFVGANLMESTPAGSSSLVLRLKGASQGLEYFIDPMTYVFGKYSDYDEGDDNSRLDWLKSHRKVNDEDVFDFKRSYQKMAAEFGQPFSLAVQRSQALVPADFPNQRTISTAVSKIVQYQMNRIRQEFEKDPELAEYAERAPTPGAIFAPYFYIDPGNREDWYSLQMAFAAETASAAEGTFAGCIVCIDSRDVEDNAFMERLSTDIRGSGIGGVWLWASKLRDTESSVGALKGLHDFVLRTAPEIQVNLLHSGYFGLALGTVGVEQVSHGLGYGEQKNVVPIIGQALPVVSFYVPALHRRVSPQKVRDFFPALGVRSAKDYFEKVCDCVVCKGIISNGLDAFSEFCETQFSSPDSHRPSQTPDAAKKNRYHFLLNRIRERDEIRSQTIADVRSQLRAAGRIWNGFPYIDHIGRWLVALA